MVLLVDYLPGKPHVKKPGMAAHAAALTLRWQRQEGQSAFLAIQTS